jgi:hypothetical protein
MERKDARAWFYSPKAIPRKERRIERKGFGFIARRRLQLEEGDAPDKWARDVSDAG